MFQPAHFILILLCFVILSREVLCFRISLGHAMRLPTKFYGKNGKIPRFDDKVRVQLLADVERIGHKGDILKVSKEQWMNVLLPRKVSMIVHDYETEKIDKALLVMALRRTDERNALMKCISDLPVLEMKEHASKLKLYEVVTGKKILDLLKKQLEPKQVAQMTVKEIGMYDILLWNEDTKKFMSFNYKTLQEIRVAGLFQVILRMKASDQRFSYQVRIIPTIPDILM